MQQAQSAIDAARTAGADEYAHDELAAAEGALARARTAVEQRDYRWRSTTRSTAASARRPPRRKPPARRRPHAPTPSAHSTAAAATLAEAQARLKAAQTSGVPARRLAAARRSVAAGDQAVQEARAAFDQGSFRNVPQALNEPMKRLAATSHDLEAAPRPAARRRR